MLTKIQFIFWIQVLSLLASINTSKIVILESAGSLLKIYKVYLTKSFPFHDKYKKKKTYCIDGIMHLCIYFLNKWVTFIQENKVTKKMERAVEKHSNSSTKTYRGFLKSWIYQANISILKGVIHRKKQALGSLTVNCIKMFSNLNRNLTNFSI